jgi:hypothetical protein
MDLQLFSNANCRRTVSSRRRVDHTKHRHFGDEPTVAQAGNPDLVRLDPRSGRESHRLGGRVDEGIEARVEEWGAAVELDDLAVLEAHEVDQ